VWHDSFTCVTWLIHMCDMTHSHVGRDAFIRATCLIHVRDDYNSRGLHVWHDSTRVTWLNRCDMTQQVWHDSPVCVTWLIDMCYRTYSRGKYEYCAFLPSCHRTHSRDRTHSRHRTHERHVTWMGPMTRAVFMNTACFCLLTHMCE